MKDRVCSLLLIVVALAVTPVLLGAGAGVPFTVNGGSDNASPADLKHRAVREYLEKLLGNRFDQYEKLVTPEFAERYIMDYKVSRAAGNKVQLTGHLDSDALKGWVRLSETRRGATTMKPMLILSSAIPGLTLSPAATESRAKDSPVGQVVLSEASNAFQKFNTRLGTAGGSGLSLSQPPRTDGELKSLRDYAVVDGYSSVLWIHLLPCKTCGGTRMDLHLYTLSTLRQALAKSEDLALSGGDYSSSSRIRTAMKPAFQGLKTELEQMVSDGTLFSSAYRLTVEGIDSYRSFKKVENELSSLDFIVQAVLKRSEPKLAEFEVLSSLPGEELMARLDGENFNGFHLKPVRVDSRNLTVRYLR